MSKSMCKSKGDAVSVRNSIRVSVRSCPGIDVSIRISISISKSDSNSDGTVGLSGKGLLQYLFKN